MTALANTLVSTTRRREIRMNPGASILQDVGKDFLGHSPCCRLSTDTVHGLLKLGDIVLTNPLIFLGGHDHGDIAVLAANEDRLALGRVEKGCEPLFSICSGYRSHLSSLDEVDKLVKPPFYSNRITRFPCYTVLVSSTNRLRNVTVTLEEDVARWARIEAARRDTSVSRLLGELLKERMGKPSGKSPVSDAAGRLAGFGKRHRLSLRGLKIKDLINEGRR